MGSLGSEQGLQRRAHILMVPLSGSGHHYPFIQLLYYCVGYKDVAVTVVSNNERIAELYSLKSKGEFRDLDLRLETVFGTPPSYPSDPLFPIRAALVAKQYEAEFGPFAAKLIKERDEPGAPTSVVSDMFFGFTQDLASQLGVPWYPLYVASPGYARACLEGRKLLQYAEGLRLQESPRRNEVLSSIPGLEYARVGDLPHEMFEFPDFQQSHSERMSKASALLFNTVEDLDAEALDAIRAGTQVKANAEHGQAPRILSIGPILNFPGFSGRHRSSAHPPTETPACLKFLSSHAPSSVLYISFGSLANISAESMTELAHGLEASGVPFLWVLKLVRMPKLSELLPPGFEERTRGRGFIETGWAPQAEILLHSSTGGFLSHCGWNSTLESLCAGVPLITWPLSADQPLNARFISEVLRAGIAVVAKEFEEGDESLVLPGREDVQKAVKLLMLEDKGRQLKKNAEELQKRLEAAVADGGSSHRSLNLFIHEILNGAESLELPNLSNGRGKSNGYHIQG